MRTIDLGDNITVTMKKSVRAKRIRIIVRPFLGTTIVLPFFVSYVSGELFLRQKKEWIAKKLQDFASRPSGFLSRGSKEEYNVCKEEAKKLIEDRLEEYQSIYQVSWNKVSIRNQKTRWGSCYRQKNLSFSYRLFLLPPRFCDYVIVHELCHLKEMNHSPKFWALVARTFPDYKKLRREMKAL